MPSTLIRVSPDPDTGGLPVVDVNSRGPALGRRGRPVGRSWSWPGSALLPAVFIGSLLMFLWRIGDPAAWIDEAASWQAAHRSWPQLLQLVHGTDAPLVPYYVVLKLWMTFGLGMDVLRMSSALAAAAAVTVLAALLRRWDGPMLAVIASVLLTSMSGFDRYAQELRPYALLALASCLSWLAWESWTRTRRPIAGAVYALSVAFLASSHLFGLLIVPAQVLADLMISASVWRVRWRLGVRTGLWAAAGVCLAAGPMALALINGAGPSIATPVTARTLVQTEKMAIAYDVPGYTVLVASLILAAVGVGMITRPRWRRLVAVLVWWACLPVVLGVMVALLQPNTLRSRYWIGALPPMAALMAVGAMALASWAVGWARSWTTDSAARIVGAGVVVILLVGNAGLQWPGQLRIRSEAGHGEDGMLALREAQRLAAADSAPIVVSPMIGSLVMATIAPQATGIAPLSRINQNSTNIWPVRRTTTQVASALAGAAKVLWLYRSSAISGTQTGPRTKDGERAAALALAIEKEPRQLVVLRYRVLSAFVVSSGWILVTLVKG